MNRLADEDAKISKRFSDEEAQAIAYNDGMYVPERRPVALKEEPLLLLLHWADMWTASVRER